MLARLRPIVSTRRRLLVARGADLISGGFPLYPTLDSPHWTVAVAEPTPSVFAEVRGCFEGPIDNPAWVGRVPPVE